MKIMHIHFFEFESVKTYLTSTKKNRKEGAVNDRGGHLTIQYRTSKNAVNLMRAI